MLVRQDLVRLASVRDHRRLEVAERSRRNGGEISGRSARRDREGVLLDPRGRYTVDVFSGYLSTPIILSAALRDRRFLDDSQRAFAVNRGYMEDPETGLWYSRWGHALHPNRNNPGLWSRGNGWLVAAWGEPCTSRDPAHSGYRTMLKAWQQYCCLIAAFQQPSGLFRQLLNRPTSFEEASGTALFCTGFALGARHGTLPAEFGTIAWRAFCGLRRLTDRDGNIHNTSTYAGGYNYERQYETCARYNEPHGDGTTISACVAMHQLLAAKKPVVDRTKPIVQPAIVTKAVPGCITTEPPDRLGPQRSRGPDPEACPGTLHAPSAGPSWQYYPLDSCIGTTIPGTSPSWSVPANTLRDGVPRSRRKCNGISPVRSACAPATRRMQRAQGFCRQPVDSRFFGNYILI